MGQFMKPASSLFCWCVQPSHPYAEDFEQTLAETPRYIPTLSAVICGMDWQGRIALQSSCVIQETVHQAAEADAGACLMSTEMSESESQMGAGSQDVRNRIEQNQRDSGNNMSFIVPYEKTEA